MIHEAKDFLSRYSAVKFVTSIAPYDAISPSRREEIALNYAITAPQFCAIDDQDANSCSRLQIVPCPSGPAPIFYSEVDGEIVGAAVCSTPFDPLPLRGQMLAVHPSQRGNGIATDLVAHVIAAAPIVGGAPVPHMIDWFRTKGLSIWLDGAIGPVGFTAEPTNIDPLLYAVPAASDHELEAARQMARIMEA